MTTSNRDLVRTALLVVIPVAVLVGIIILGTRLRAVEEILGYRPLTGDSEEYLEDAGPVHVVYVPAYSHVFFGAGDPHLLSVTLSVRNTDPAFPITITSVRYYDSAGALVREHLEGGLRLAPLASAEFLVREVDTTGGAGANFIVEWAADRQVHRPIVEAIMIGGTEDRGLSFVSRGVKLVRAPVDEGAEEEGDEEGG